LRIEKSKIQQKSNKNDCLCQIAIDPVTQLGLDPIVKLALPAF
jgi:hypothetical protein